jgi:hypothetical protein
MLFTGVVAAFLERFESMEVMVVVPSSDAFARPFWQMRLVCNLHM